MCRRGRTCRLKVLLIVGCSVVVVVRYLNDPVNSNSSHEINFWKIISSKQMKKTMHYISSRGEQELKSLNCN